MSEQGDKFKFLGSSDKRKAVFKTIRDKLPGRKRDDLYQSAAKYAQDLQNSSSSSTHDIKSYTELVSEAQVIEKSQALAQLIDKCNHIDTEIIDSNTLINEGKSNYLRQHNDYKNTANITNEATKARKRQLLLQTVNELHQQYEELLR